MYLLNQFFMLIFVAITSLFICSCSKDDNPVAPAVNSDTIAVTEMRDYFKAGEICSTGNKWDFAINGTSLFAMKQDDEVFYLRKPGSFFLDKNGQLIKEFSGPTMLGWPLFNRDTVDTFQFDKAVPIQVQALNTISRPKATTEVSFKGNIVSDNNGLGTILYSSSFYHRIDEFNTLGLGGANASDNNYGVYNAMGGAHAAVALTFADVASDQGVVMSTPLTELRNASGENLLIKTGDLLFVTATINDGVNDETITASFEVIDDPLQAGTVGGSITGYRVNTIQQFLLSMEHFFTQSSVWNGGSGSNITDAHVAIMPDGQVRVANGPGSSQAIRNLTVRSDRPISRTYVSSAFSFQSDIPVGGYSETTNRILRPAKSTDNLFNPMVYDNLGVGTDAPVAQIFTSRGNLIDIEQGDRLQISALVGNASKNGATLSINVGTNLRTSTTMQDILTYIQNTLDLPERDGTIYNGLSVSVNNAGTEDDHIPEGAIVIKGQPEIAFAINNMSVVATNSNALTPVPSEFNSNMVVTQLQAARNSVIINLPFTIYDKIGAEHICTLRLLATNQDQPSVWFWGIITSNNDSLLSGGYDNLTFATDGSPSSFGSNNSSSQIKILNANNRGDTIKFLINWGPTGSFSGITQFYSTTTLSVNSKNGYPAGLLESYSIDTKGTIHGNFDNGQTYPLWQIALCNFPCREGLRSVGSGYFFKTDLSGEPIFGNIGKTLKSILIPGAVEK